MPDIVGEDSIIQDRTIKNRPDQNLLQRMAISLLTPASFEKPKWEFYGQVSQDL
jgi:hypothetical protein